MAARIIVEVRQRAWGNASLDRELGFFTDTSMADQAIQACYREAWKTVCASSFEGSEWFPAEAKKMLQGEGWDIWYPNDVNSPEPLFYKVEHRIWSQVPSSMQNFAFSIEGAEPF
jgi:hypothetical protein